MTAMATPLRRRLVNQAMQAVAVLAAFAAVAILAVMVISVAKRMGRR